MQDYIYRNSLYLREPQYKQIIRAGYLRFEGVERPGAPVWEELRAVAAAERCPLPETDTGDGVLLLRHARSGDRILGFLTLRTVNDRELYGALAARIWRMRCGAARQDGCGC